MTSDKRYTTSRHERALNRPNPEQFHREHRHDPDIIDKDAPTPPPTYHESEHQASRHKRSSHPGPSRRAQRGDRESALDLDELQQRTRAMALAPRMAEMPPGQAAPLFDPAPHVGRSQSTRERRAQEDADMLATRVSTRPRARFAEGDALHTTAREPVDRRSRRESRMPAKASYTRGRENVARESRAPEGMRTGNSRFEAPQDSARHHHRRSLDDLDEDHIPAASRPEAPGRPSQARTRGNDFNEPRATGRSRRDEPQDGFRDTRRDFSRQQPAGFGNGFDENRATGRSRREDPRDDLEGARGGFSRHQEANFVDDVDESRATGRSRREQPQADPRGARDDFSRRQPTNFDDQFHEKFPNHEEYEEEEDLRTARPTTQRQQVPSPHFQHQNQPQPQRAPERTHHQPQPAPLPARCHGHLRYKHNWSHEFACDSCALSQSTKNATFRVRWPASGELVELSQKKIRAYHLPVSRENYAAERATCLLCKICWRMGGEAMGLGFDFEELALHLRGHGMEECEDAYGA